MTCPHFRDYRQECGCACRRNEDRGSRCHPNHKCWIGDDMVPEVIIAFLRCSGWAIASCYAHNDDEDCNVYAEEPCPGPVPASVHEHRPCKDFTHSHPIFSNLRTLAQATTSTKDNNVHHTVHAAWLERALKHTERPTMPDPAHITYATMNRKPTTSRRTGPPTTYAMSAMEWQCACRLRKLPCTIAKSKAPVR